MATLPIGPMEMDRNPNPLRDDLIYDQIMIDKDSMITLSDMPGLGVDVDEQLIARYRLDL
jgi:L-alanine-DL-glutamate epimerase-like enolase superfamily enzyme